jgi:hypothetical protein
MPGDTPLEGSEFRSHHLAPWPRGFNPLGDTHQRCVSPTPKPFQDVTCSKRTYSEQTAQVLKEAKVFACLVVLVLAIWGALRVQAPPRRAHACRTAADHAVALPPTTSRDAVRRSSFLHASRAPGPLCERVLVSVLRRKRLSDGPRVFRRARWFTRARSCAPLSPGRHMLRV